MAEPLAEEPLPTADDPDEIATRTFDTARRGYDQGQVRGYLGAVAAALRDASRVRVDLERQLADAQERAAAAASVTIDERTLTERLGEEASSVLYAAREAAAKRAETAEAEAQEVLARASEEAEQLRTEAETILAERTQEAEQVAGAVRRDAEAEARGLVEEARVLRNRVLEDMAAKRQSAKVQIERLRGGRDRLLATYDVVQRTLDEVRQELKFSVSEAKVAADAASRRAQEAPTPTPGELEAEVTEARAAGLLPAPAEAEEPEPEPEAVEPEPEPEPEAVAPEPEPEPEAQAEEEPAELEAVEPPEPYESVTVVEPEPEPDEEDPAAEDQSVDDLFARIRADAEPEPEPEPEPEAPVELSPELEAICRTVERRLKKVLADEQNSIIEQAKRGDEQPSWGSDAEHAARYADAIATQLQEAWSLGRGVERSEPPEQVDELVSQHTSALVAVVRDRVGGAWGGTGDERIAAIRVSYREAKGELIAPAARDLTAAIHGLAADS